MQGLGVVWLDGRAMKGTRLRTVAGTALLTAGAMSVRFAAFDRTWKQTSEVPVDLRVCECCPTTAAVTAEGPIVAYRDRSDNEVRDIYCRGARRANGPSRKPSIETIGTSSRVP